MNSISSIEQKIGAGINNFTERNTDEKTRNIKADHEERVARKRRNFSSKREGVCNRQLLQSEKVVAHEKDNQLAIRC